MVGKRRGRLATVAEHFSIIFFSLALTGSLEGGEGQGRSALCNSSFPKLCYLEYPEFLKIAFDVCKDTHLFLFDTYRGHGYQNRQWLASVEDGWLPLPIIFSSFLLARLSGSLEGERARAFRPLQFLKIILHI